MRSREETHRLLVEHAGGAKVYFQPPESYKMEYPCIVYERTNVPAIYADDMPYITRPVYQVTAIERNPEAPLGFRIGSIPGAQFNRHFVSDNLHHNVYTLSTL